MEDTLLIGRVIKSDGTSIPILPRYVKPTDAVAAALRELLFKSGYAVSPDRPAWDLKETTIRPEWGTILVGGTIDELDVTCLETFTMKRYSAKARVTLIFADVQKKRIFYRVTSESSSSLDHIFFSEEKTGEPDQRRPLRRHGKGHRGTGDGPPDPGGAQTITASVTAQQKHAP